MNKQKSLRRSLSLFARFQYRLMTSSLRTLPDFLVIGGQKCGTTSLHRYMRLHPNIISPYKKDSGYFDANYYRGFAWYRAFFPLQSQMDKLRAGGGHFTTGEVTTTYIHHPLAAERAGKTLPQSVKIIALLREPAARAYSHYQHMVRTGRETLSFKDAISMEDERLNGIVERVMEGGDEALRTYRNYSYKSRGRYAEQLKRWLAKFPRENFLLLKSEDLFQNPDETSKLAYELLGIPDHKLDKYENANPGKYSDADAKIIAELKEYFRPYNQELYKLVGMDFGWH